MTGLRRFAYALVALLGAATLATPVVATEAPTVALVLGGGSARGASHIGVIRALNEAGVPVDLIVGTSMGSVVGGLYAAGFSTETLAELVVEVSPIRFAELRLPPPGGLLDAEPFEILVRALTDGVGLDETLIPFAPVVTDLASHDPVALEGGDLAAAMHASMAIPILFAPVEIDGRFYYDGGVKAAVPVLLARERGADVVIAVDVTRAVDDDPGNILVNFQVIYLDLTTEYNEAQLAAVDVLLDPGLQRESYMAFDRVDAFVEAGYRAAVADLPELLELLRERGVTLREPGDPHASNPLNLGWQERLRQAGRLAADRPTTLSITPEVGLGPSPYQSGYDAPIASPLSVARLGASATGGALGRVSVGASVGVSTRSDAYDLAFRAGYRFSDAWRVAARVERDLEAGWELDLGVSYRYRDFDDLDGRVTLELAPLSGRVELAGTVETTGLRGAVEVSAVPLALDHARAALDLRLAGSLGEAFVHARVFAGLSVAGAPPEALFGFGAPLLMRGTPLRPVERALVGNLEVGWQAGLGRPLADAVLVRPFAWGFVDAGYAPGGGNVAVGAGVGVSGLLFGFEPFELALDAGYGLGSGSVSLGVRGRYWPEPLPLAPR